MSKSAESKSKSAQKPISRVRQAPVPKYKYANESHDLCVMESAGFDRTLLFLDATRQACTVIVNQIEELASDASLRARFALRVRSAINDLEEASLQALVDASPVRRVAPAKAILEVRAIEAVLGGTEWFTASEVGFRHKQDAVNPHASVSRWQKEGKVFSILHSGQRLYPRYIFDELGNPLPIIKDVLHVLRAYLPFRIASWFESTNAMLGGKRPREMAATDPQAVLAAAMDHVVGAVHG